MMTMGDRIHQLRKDNNMTQEELGQKLGIGRSAVLKYEKGDVQNIPASKIQKMATIFGVTPSYLMGFDLDRSEEEIATEAMLVENIQKIYGKSAVKLLSLFQELNTDGRLTALNYIEDLTLIEKYTN